MQDTNANLKKVWNENKKEKTMTINAYCSPPANRLKEYQHEGCPGIVYKYSGDIAEIENRELVPCSCPCHAKKETR
tara:strand:- start:21 stop:248 length:228 start_codon:yes stop_codon:yes gene_type:complete